MNLLFWGLTIGVIGKILLAAGVIIAHTKIAHEKQIDKEVIDGFRFEMWITVVGVALIVIGYLIEIYFYGYTPLLSCTAEECAAALGSVLRN